MLKKAVLLAILLLVVIATPVLASNGEAIPTFDEALIYASGVGIAVIVGFVISLLLDYWRDYADLTTAQKRALYAGFCLVVPVGAAVLRGVLGYVAWSFDPLIWHALWCGVATWVAGTAVHNKIKKVAR